MVRTGWEVKTGVVITMVEYAGTVTTRAGTATVTVPAHFVADRMCDCSSVVVVPALDEM